VNRKEERQKELNRMREEARAARAQAAVGCPDESSALGANASVE
jgi:uncharacterized protein YbjQ (UPF0145 family)